MTDETKASLIRLYPTYTFPDCQFTGMDRGEKFGVICPEHGIFTTCIRQILYRKRGCPTCMEESGERIHKRSRESVIEELKEIYKGKDENIDWDSSICNGSTDITLICKIHGPFKKSMQSLKAGYGCKQCTHRARYDNRIADKAKQFEAKARAIHGDKYDYTKTVYTGSLNDIIVTCQIHGDYTVRASNHVNRLQPVGCPFCAGSATCDSDFKIRVEEATQGEVLVGPIQDQRHKVDARCLKCGHSWRAWPKVLLEGHRCPICHPGGFNPNVPGRLYLVEFTVNEAHLYKIGVTNRRVRQRIVSMSVSKGVNHKILADIKFLQGRNALLLEQEMLIELTQYQYMGEPFAANGMTEIFTKDPRKVLKDHPFIS